MDFLFQLIFATAFVLAVPSLLYLLGRRYASRFFRRLAYETHLWIGVISGLILFVVCLSGTLLTFKTETIMFLERDRYHLEVSPEAKPKTLEELVPEIEKIEDGKVVRVTIPENTSQAWIFNVRKNETAGPKRGGPPSGMPAMHAMLGTAYLVNPYTGESLGPQRSKTYMFFIMLQFLHRFLLLDIRTGQIVVGTATLVFVFLIVGGLCLWLPAKLKSMKSYLPGMKIRTGKGWSRFFYDIHNTLGFYALIPLMVMALTGPIISFQWYRNAAGKVLGTQPFSKSFEKPLFSQWDASKKRETSWDDFIAKTNEISKRKGTIQIYLPQSPKGSISVRKIGSGFCTIAATDKIQFDQYSGEVLKSDLFDQYSFGEKVSTLIFPLHNGEIFGTISKIVYFFACLVATTLPITGVILWVGKLRNRRKAKMKRRELERDAQEKSTPEISLRLKSDEVDSRADISENLKV